MPKQTARDSRLVAGSDVIHRMAVSVGLGDVLASQALWYFECSSNSATSQPIIDVWSAACLYLAIRMHQLPISTAQVAAAVKQDSKLILKLFQKVATACKINPPAVDFTNFTLHSMTKMPGVQPATKVKVLDLYVKLIAWLEKARPKNCVNNSWAAAACQHAMTFYKVEVEPQHLSKLFGIKEAAFATRAHELRQLVVAAAKGLPSSTYPECLTHISVLPVLPALAHFTDQGDNDDNDNTLEAMENTTSRASDLSVEGDITALPTTAAASSCKGQLQRPATSATADVPQQAALPGAYAKLAVHDMINMHDVSLPIKMQVLQLYVRLMVWLDKDTSAGHSYWAAAALQIAMLYYKIPFLPSNLAGHVKVDMLGKRAHEIKKLLTAAARSSCVSYSVCVHKIASMPCSLLPDATQAATSGKVPQAANSTRPLDAAASSQQQKQANLPAVVQSTVPVPPLEASPGLTEQQHAADSADTHTSEAFNGTEAAVQREPAPAADSAQQGVLPLATCAPSSMPIQPSLIPQAAPAAQHMAVTNSRELRSQTEAPALMTKEADLNGLQTADLDPGTVPHPPVPTPHQLAPSQGPPAPAARVQTSDAVMSNDSDLGQQKLQSGMLTSRVRVAEQAQRLMLQPVLHRLSHSSSEGNSAPSTADRLAKHEQSQAQIPVSEEQRSAPQLQSAVACPVSPLPAQGGVPMQQQQQQPLAVLQGPAVQQLHKLLQQMESTAQTNASLALLAQPNEHLHAATVAGRALEDGLPASWVRAAPAQSQQHEPQQALPVSLPAAGNSDPSERGLSPWVLLPGPLHAAIACAMAQEGASPTQGGTPRAAQGLSLVGPDGKQGRGVKRPRADSAARAASTGGPGQGAQQVATVRGHAAHIPASGPAAAQVKSASILPSDLAGNCCLTMRRSSASEQPAASVQLGLNNRLADGGTAGSAQRADSSTPADPTQAANPAVEAVPTQQARSASPNGSPAVELDSPLQAASALRDDSPQAFKQAQQKVPASKKALSGLQEQHLHGEQDTRQGSPALHDGSPGGLQPAGSQAKRGRSEATLDVSMSGADQNAGIDVDVSRVATPSRGKSVCVDDMAPPSSKLRRINEHEAQDALLLLHDHDSQQALQQKQGSDSDSRAGAREHDASVDSVEHDMTKDAVDRPAPFTDVDGNPDAYEVDRIIDHRSWNAGSLVRVQYLVRWKGYGPEDDTWQSKTSLRHAREAIQEYHNSTQ